MNSARSITIPSHTGVTLKHVFSAGPNSPYTEPDANIKLWLPRTYPSTAQSTVTHFGNTKYLKNKEALRLLGCHRKHLRFYVFAPQEIRWMTERAMTHPRLFLRNGMRNMFPIMNWEDETIYLMGMKWKPKVKRFAIHIFDADDRSRGWNPGNRWYKKVLD